MTCKRQKQCNNGKICRYANNDDYNLCGGSCYRPKEPQTNEEWLRTLPADERVKEVLNRGFMTEERTAEEFFEWLKEIHHAE